MKIAMVAPPWHKIPPKRYGGIEAVVSLLADGLIERKHEVTLFTVSETSTKALAFKSFEEEMKSYLDKPPASFLNVALTHVLASYREISRGRYDVIHDHTWKEGLCCAAMADIPLVHTIHSPPNEENVRFYSLFKDYPGVNFVTISKFQQTRLPKLNYLGTVYNAIDISKYPYSASKEDFFLYLGRFNPEKAPHIACELAEEAGERLILAGKARESEELNYFGREINHHLSDNIQYLGEVSEEKKMELLSKAKGFLLPLQWDEPFGIVAVEAMACGTPAITFNRGASPELVLHEVTGYVVDTAGEFAEAMKRVDEIDPRKCRERAEKMFQPKTMIDGYERVYAKVLKNP